jgi:hypothetical protein
VEQCIRVELSSLNYGLHIPSIHEKIVKGNYFLKQRFQSR